MSIPLIVDTDIGGDIDDALAVSMALHSPELDVIGITTVYRANQWRLGIVESMLKAYGREDIPVRAGAENPLVGSWQEGGEEPIRLPNEAVPFLIEQARAHEQLYIAAIGPLTNIALAIAQAPDIVPRLVLTIMGGMITCAYPEWNILSDPEAADIVFSCGARIRMVGLDVTERCSLSEEQAHALVTGEGEELHFLRGEMDRFLRSFDFLPTLHDPLAMASLLWDDLLTFEPCDICIETQGKHTRGVTVKRRFSGEKRVEAACGVLAGEAVRRIIERVRARPEV